MRILAGALVLTLIGCAATKPPVPPAGAEPHVGEDWFVWRAGTLGITVDEAKARDAKLPDGTNETAPPEGTLDANTQLEAAILWNQECARCHGIDGQPPEVEEGQVQPKAWGGMAAMGFLMGGDAMRAGIYKTIDNGKGTMAGWGDALSREQMWALVAHIESF